MVRPTYLLLHRSEWERINRQTEPPPVDPVHQKKEYMKALTEQSQEWIKTWPDTVSGHIAQLEKQKKEQKKANIAFVKEYLKNKKQENTAGAIKEAKQLIFENSNYGRLLKSALLESRALEVREAQIKFKKQLEEKAAEIAKDQDKRNKYGFLHFHHNETEKEQNGKVAAIECNRINKQIISQRKEEALKINKHEEECVKQDVKLLQQLLVIEEKEKNDVKRCVKKSIDDYEAANVDIEKRKTQEKTLDDALTEVYKKGQDRIKCKIQTVLKTVHQGRPDTKWSKDHYEKIDQLQQEEKKRYEDFINKGVSAYEKRLSNKEEKDKEQQKLKSSAIFLISQRNKIAGEEDRLAKKCANKCDCDRQSLIMKTRKMKSDDDKTTEDTEKKTTDKLPANTENLKQSKCITGSDKTKQPPFLSPRNVQLEELKKREKEPSPWNDAKGVHAQFAQQANDVLKEITHKHFARKVVNEYRKLNCLDSTKLPVPNY